MRLVHKAGFKAFEIHLGTFEGCFGNPWLIPHAGVWPRTFSKQERKKLKEELQSFDRVIIHGTPTDVNIAALNPGIREESQRQYIEAIELAADTGVKYVTFHPGRQSNSVHNPKEVRKHNINFALRVLPLAEKYNLCIAYESFDLELLKAIKNPRFGLLLDMGHAVMGASRGDTNTILEWIDKIGKRLIEVHAHNVMNWAEVPERGIAHRSFDYGTCLDLTAISRKLKKVGYLNPIIFEILEPTAERTIEKCLQAKETILKVWE
ncbi:sugar phosphate isomerase/epimerase [bacterium]|nr:sugar phosphate isomerase/epimerase [bacterium]